MKRIARRLARILLIAATLVAGCSLQPGADLDIDAADRAVASAVHAGAAELAAPDLDRARDKIALARRWAEARDERPAKWLAQQARVDSELAQMRAITARARSGALDATEDFRRVSASASRAR